MEVGLLFTFLSLSFPGQFILLQNQIFGGNIPWVLLGFLGAPLSHPWFRTLLPFLQERGWWVARSLGQTAGLPAVAGC